MVYKSRLELTVMAFAGFAGILDTSFLIPIIALYAQSLGATEAQAGLVVGLYSMAAIPFSIIAGLLVDRLGRRKMLVTGLLLDSASMLLYAVVTSWVQLAVVRVFHAIGGSLVFPALIARAREVSEAKVGAGLGAMLAPISLSIAIGSASAGVATAFLGYRISFALIALIQFVAGVLASTLSPELEEKAWRGLRGVVSGLREVGSTVMGGLVVIMFLYVALGIIVGGIATSLVGAGILGEREARLVMGVGVGLSSLVATVFFIVNGVVVDRVGVIPVVLYSSLLGAIAFILPTINITALTVIAGLAVFGVGLAGLMLSSTIMISQAPSRARGTAIGLQQVFNIVGVAIGAPLGGTLAETGPELVLLAAGIALLMTLIAIPLARS